MTPELRAALKTLGLSGRKFAALTGLSDDTVSGWGRKQRETRGVQKVPAWVPLLITAWQASPDALEAARRSLNQEAAE
jgi:hypothetical protein